MTWDYSLEEASDGTVLAHEPTCPDVRALAERGLPVATMYGCKEKLPPEYPRHSCLRNEEPDLARGEVPAEPAMVMDGTRRRV